jgi:hypothetical protein
MQVNVALRFSCISQAFEFGPMVLETTSLFLVYLVPIKQAFCISHCPRIRSSILSTQVKYLCIANNHLLLLY